MISRTELQRISQLHDDSGHLLSLYLPLFRNKSDIDYNIELKNLLREADQRFQNTFDTDLPDEFESLFDDIRVLLRDNGSQYGRGVALFATPGQGVIESHPMPETIESSAIVNQRPNMAPLIRLFEDHAPYCTCIISRDDARILLGHLDEINEYSRMEDDDVPGQHDQGGWSQARYERHIEDHVHRHFKRVAQQLFELQQDNQYELLILGGPEEVVAGFEEFLHPYVKDCVIGTTRLLMEANINDVREHSLEIIDRNVAKRKLDLIEQVQNESRSRDLGVEGLADTMEALQRGQVMNLVVDNQLRSSGIVCQDCGAFGITPGPDNTCTYCQSGATKDVENIIPYLITSAFEQGAGVSIVDNEDQKEQLAQLGGIAALLRFRVEEQTA